MGTYYRGTRTVNDVHFGRWFNVAIAISGLLSSLCHEYPSSSIGLFLCMHLDSSTHHYRGFCVLLVVVSGDRGSNKCPKGYTQITDYQTCAAASAALLNPQPHDKQKFYHQDHQNWYDPGYPTGCMYFHNHQASRLNNARSGKGNMNAYLICIGE